MGEAERGTDSLRSVATRERVQERLERLVRENRFTIAVVFPVIGAALLTASAAELVPPPLAFNPLAILVGTLVMRLPLAVALGPLLDRRTGVALAAVTAYAYAVEFVGVRTGWPYGEFSYGVSLGPMIGGEIPLGLPVFFLPLVLNSYLLCLLLLGDRADRAAVRLPLAVAAVLSVDLVLDPAAVSLGFWSYATGGTYYGVPASNVAGWLLSAAVAVGLVDLGFDHRSLRTRVDACPFALDDLVSFVLLWGVVNAVFGNWVPVAVAGLFVLGLARVGRVDFLGRS